MFSLTNTNLDMKATFNLFLILEKLKKKGTTVVLIEHRLYHAKSLFDRFLLVKDGEIAQDLSREEVIHLEGEFWDENGLRTLELEEYRIIEKKDSYQLNDESIIGKGLKFCYPNVAKDGKKQKQYILNHLDFNMECGIAIGLIGLNGTGKTTFARVISGLEKIKEGTIWEEKDQELNRKDLMDMSYFVFQDSDYQLFSESVLDEMLLGISNKDKKENTQKALGDRIHLDDVRIRQYELDIRTPKDDVLENISAALHVNKEYLKEPDYPYTEHDLMRFLFKLDDSIEVNIRPVILNDEDPEYTTTGIYFGSEAILRIRNMLEQWQEMKDKYENNEITKEALQDWKANYPDSLKKDYVPFEESNVKFCRKGITAKGPPDIK